MFNWMWVCGFSSHIQFSDILLIARVTAAGRYRIQHKVQLKKMMVQCTLSRVQFLYSVPQVSVVQSPILHNAFCIAERGVAKPFRLCAKYVVCISCDNHMTSVWQSHDLSPGAQRSVLSGSVNWPRPRLMMKVYWPPWAEILLTLLCWTTLKHTVSQYHLLNFDISCVYSSYN